MITLIRYKNTRKGFQAGSKEACQVPPSASGRAYALMSPNHDQRREKRSRKQQNVHHSLVLGLNIHVEMRLETLGNNAMKWIVWGFRLLWL